MITAHAQPGKFHVSSPARRESKDNRPIAFPEWKGSVESQLNLENLFESARLWTARFFVFKTSLAVPFENVTLPGTIINNSQTETSGSIRNGPNRSSSLPLSYVYPYWTVPFFKKEDLL